MKPLHDLYAALTERQESRHNVADVADVAAMISSVGSDNAFLLIHFSQLPK
jgi:hypothetical protein